MNKNPFNAVALRKMWDIKAPFIGVFLFVFAITNIIIYPVFAEELQISKGDIVAEETTIEPEEQTIPDMNIDPEITPPEEIQPEPILSPEQISRLEDLKGMLDRGEITEEEYNKAKEETINEVKNSKIEHGPSITGTDPKNQILGKYLKPNISPLNGSLNYEYPIIVPSGRNGLSPDIKLHYNSSSNFNNSILGAGWSLNIPYIQRTNKGGSDKIYIENNFFSSLDGELISKGGGVYVPRVENGSFLKYKYVNDYWIVYAKDGTKYVFGETESTRQNDEQDEDKIFTWMLEEITDPNGNTISYSYFKHLGQIYPDTISYNQDGFYSIKFYRSERETSTSSYFPGFRTITAYRISSIKVMVDDITAIKYTISSSNNLIKNIKVEGYKENQSLELPPVSFKYPVDDGETKWENGSNFNLPTDGNGRVLTLDFTSGNSYGNRFIDLNGDGLLDVLRWKSGYANGYVSSDFTSGNQVFLNTGTGFALASNFVLPTTSTGQVVTLEYTDPSGTFGNKIIDVNGDGLPDILRWSKGSPNGFGGLLAGNQVFLNTGKRFELAPNFLLPTQNGKVMVLDYNYFHYYGNSFKDVNGDGRPDIIRWMSGYGNGYTTSDLKSGNQIFINQKDDSGFVLDPNFILPVSIHGKVLTLESSESMGIYGNKFEDLNGDGLLDILRWRSGKPNGYVSTPLDTDGNQVFLNTGYSFVLDPEFLLPTDGNGNVVVIEYKKGNLMGTDNLGNKIMDVNGDGLNDILRWRAGQPNGYSSVPFGNQVFLNTGRGFVLDPEYFLPTDGNGKVPTLEYDYGNFPSGNKVYGNLFKDVNGDSRIDIVRWTKGYPNGYTNSYGSNANQVFINTGHSFVLDSDFILPTDGSGMVLNINRNDGSSFGNLFEDINGDKIPDIVRWRAGQPNGYTSLNNGNEILSNMTGRQEVEEITNQNGGKDIFSYKRIRGFTENDVGINRKLPEDYETFVVISHTTDDSNGNIGTTFYEYKNAGYYFAVPFERKFTGFSETTETNPDGSIITTKYHQNNGNSNNEDGDSYAKIGKLYEKTIRDEDGNLYLRAYTKYEENDLGNNSTSILPKQELIQRYDDGNNHTDTALEYEYDDYGNITRKIDYGKVEGISSGNFNDIEDDKKIVEYIYDYDTTKYIVGNPKKETLKDNEGERQAESNFTYDANGNLIMKTDWISGASYAINTYTYDNVGMLLSETNPLGKTTTYTYDTENLYPIEITNPLGHITSFTYDYIFGKVKQTTDPNGFVYQNIYDPLGRLIEEKAPSQIAPYASVLKNEYVYTDTISNKNVKTLEYLDSKNNRETYEYFDGFGRVIQTRSEGEMSNDFNVKDIVYDNMGLVKKESLNYASIGSARTNKTTTDHLYANYTYDTLGRILSLSNSIGTTTTSYQGFKNTVTDPNGKVKNYYKDAYGNLIKVEEKNGTDTYTTNYEWNTLGKLTKITDALGNIRNFSYDQLGRRLTAEDLHAPLDLTFGIWTYVYDNAGNIIRTTLPDGKVTTYTYDSLGRKTVEDYLGTTGEDIAYLYDCLNNIGKLCSAFTQTATNTHYTYNSNGLVLSEKKIIDGISFVNTYTYDIAGNITNIIYPDGGEVHYVYNLAGLLDRVETKESGGTFVNVISNIDYNPMGNIKNITYPNLTTTTNSYDDTKGYRLTRKLTQTNLLSKIQDLNYTYDNVGNITKIVDASNTNASKITNYTYDDLYRLLSATVTSSANGQNYIERFTYDSIGNILTKNENEIYAYGSIEGGEYANPHALTKITAPTFSHNYIYDKNGNVIKKTSKTSAILSGSVNGNGSTTNAWYETSVTGSQKLAYGPLPILPYVLNNLDANTNYQMRIVAQNEEGTTYGDWITFATGGNLKPAIFSSIATPSTTSAKFKGSVSGSGESTYAWYESSKTGSQKLQYTKIENCTTPTTLPTYTLSGLTKDTSYRMRVVAQNKYGTTYGNWINFRTKGAIEPDRSPIINSSIATPNTPLSLWNSVKYDFSYRNELKGIQGLLNNNLYVYDSEGNRVKATVGGVGMYYPSKLYSRISSSDKTKYIYVNNSLIATVRTVDSTTTPYYIHTDHLGSTNAVSNSTGTVAELLDYYSYGSDKTSTGSCDIRRKYIGEYCDNDTSLAYLNARYYNSYSGRFISIDPMFWSPEKFLMDPQQLNSYSYARNNPIVYRDPSGEIPEEWKTWQYWEDSGAQLIKGNYTENVTLFGTAGQVLTGIFGVDLPGDIRDVFYDVTHWEWSWDHAGKTGLDVISFVPVIGVLKYSDEAKVVLKSGEVKNVFRGGSSLEISKNQLNIDKNSGKILPGKGASVNINPKDPNILKYGGPYRVDSLSEGLKIEQRGKSLDHYEIMPKSAMTFEKYQELLNKIKLTPINK